jgi:hypothetical protein
VNWAPLENKPRILLLRQPTRDQKTISLTGIRVQNDDEEADDDDDNSNNNKNNVGKLLPLFSVDVSVV